MVCLERKADLGLRCASDSPTPGPLLLHSLLGSKIDGVLVAQVAELAGCAMAASTGPPAPRARSALASIVEIRAHRPGRLHHSAPILELLNAAGEIALIGKNSILVGRFLHLCRVMDLSHEILVIAI